MYNRRQFGVLLVACAIVLLLQISSFGIEGPPSIGIIENAWKTREHNIRSARFEWSSDFNAHLYEEDFESAGLAPPSEAEVARPVVQVSGRPDSLIFEGNKYRHQTTGLSLIDKPSSTGKIDVVAFDGELHQRFTGDRASGHGNIRLTNEFEDVSSLALTPLLLAFRPLQSGRFDLLTAKVHRQMVIVGEIPCVRIDIDIIIDNPKQSLFRSSVYVDPTRDYVPLRYEESNDGKIVVKVDIEYQLDDEHGWLPSKWSCGMYRVSGKPVEASHGVVQKYDINPDLPANAFKVRFPEGAIVRDMDRGQNNFRVDSSGNLQPYVPKALTGTNHRNWLGIGISALVVFVLSLLLFRRSVKSG